MTTPYVMDLHTHTIASGHAYGTVREMAQAAAERVLSIDATLSREEHRQIRTQMQKLSARLMN